jgi:hypothetical protein
VSLRADTAKHARTFAPDRQSITRSRKGDGMDKTTLESELADLERKYWTAIMEKDAVVALHLSHDQCVVTGSQGTSHIDPLSFREIMDVAPWILDDFQLEGVQVSLVKEDVAIVSYRVRESLIVEGEPLTIEASDSSTWVRSNGRWKCACHAMA